MNLWTFYLAHFTGKYCGFLAIIAYVLANKLPPWLDLWHIVPGPCMICELAREELQTIEIKIIFPENV